MVAFGSSPWAVAGSSDGTTGALDAVDRWTGPGAITFGVSPHVWIVLTQSGWSNGQILIVADNIQGFDTYFSLSGSFTGGSSTTRPTAPDEFVASGYIAAPYGGAGGQYVSHVMQTTDGSCTRIVNCSAGAPSELFNFETLGGPSTGLVLPTIAGRFGPAGLTPGSVLTPNTPWLNGVHSGTLWTALFCIDATGSQLMWQLTTIPNEISGDYPLFTLAIANVSQAGFRGRHGFLQDLWFTVSAANSGDYFPGDASRQFIVLGGLVYPWDGTIASLG